MGGQRLSQGTVPNVLCTKSSPLPLPHCRRCSCRLEPVSWPPVTTLLSQRAPPYWRLQEKCPSPNIFNVLCNWVVKQMKAPAEVTSVLGVFSGITSTWQLKSIHQVWTEPASIKSGACRALARKPKVRPSRPPECANLPVDYVKSVPKAHTIWPLIEVPDFFSEPQGPGNLLAVGNFENERRFV